MEILNIIQQNLNILINSEKGKSQVIKGNNDTIYQITNSKNEKELLYLFYFINNKCLEKN